jgi:hypothetical protein
MASQNVETLPAQDDRNVYLKQDPVNRLVARMEAVADSVDKIPGKMGGLFRTLIKCAKYQDVQWEDYWELVDIIAMTHEQLEKKDYLELVDIITLVWMLLDTPEA